MPVRGEVVMKTRVLVLVILVAGIGIAFSAPSWQDSVARGDEAYAADDYVVAARFYQRAVDMGCNDGIVRYRLGYSVEQVDGIDAAFRQYYSAIRLLKAQDPSHRYFDSAIAKVFPPNADPNGALWGAADLGLSDLAQTYAQRATNVNSANRDGITPLHLAVLNEDPDLIEVLLEHGARLRAAEIDLGKGRCQLDAISLAAILGHVDTFEVFLTPNVPLDVSIVYDGSLATPMAAALLEGNHTIVHMVLEAGADPSFVPNANGRGLYRDIQPQWDHQRFALHNAIYAAIRTGTSDMLRTLLDYGADPSVELRVERTSTLPVIYAAVLGNHEAVSLLIEYGADPEAMIGPTDERIAAPLIAAIWHGHADCVEALLAGGANPNRVYDFSGDYTPRGVAPLLLAAGQSTPDVLAALYDYGARPISDPEFAEHVSLVLGAQSSAVGGMPTFGSHGMELEYFGDRSRAASRFAFQQSPSRTAELLVTGDPLAAAIANLNYDNVEYLLTHGRYTANHRLAYVESPDYSFGGPSGEDDRLVIGELDPAQFAAAVVVRDCDINDQSCYQDAVEERKAVQQQIVELLQEF